MGAIFPAASTTYVLTLTPLAALISYEIGVRVVDLMLDSEILAATQLPRPWNFMNNGAIAAAVAYDGIVRRN